MGLPFSQFADDDTNQGEKGIEERINTSVPHLLQQNRVQAVPM